MEDALLTIDEETASTKSSQLYASRRLYVEGG